MSKRLTKKEMVKDIFFTATEGKRTARNFVQGMGLVEAIADNNYLWVVRRAWDLVQRDAWASGMKRISACVQLRGLVDSTRMNLLGRNLDETGRSLAFKADARVFGF